MCQLSEHLIVLLRSPTIASQMPVVFGNNAEWTGIDGYCKACDKIIHQELLRGRVTLPIPSVAVVDAAGICEPCKLVTEFHYRLHQDMRITGKDAQGRWATWHWNPSWLDRLKKSVRALFGFEKG